MITFDILLTLGIYACIVLFVVVFFGCCVTTFIGTGNRLTQVARRRVGKALTIQTIALGVLLGLAVLFLLTRLLVNAL